ncbi:hypothetical protein EDC04DRAFT_2723655 [Pisolithus marmoratus]|nr:hypothetical protein EDC04DRAFT_2723655 [Pisolithus marmoratus]
MMTNYMATLSTLRAISEDPPASTTESLLADRREQLQNSGFYLADDDIHNKVEWICHGRSHYLAVAGNEMQRQVADLSAIVQINSNNYWLMSDAGYCKGMKFCQHLYDIKPSCTISEPPMNPYKTDFTAVMNNLRILTQKTSTPGYQLGQGFFFHDNATLTPTRFKIRHILFKHLQDHKMQQSVLDIPNSSKAANYSPQNWALTHEETREELFLLQQTHHIVPIHTYDVNGELILPSEYCDSLENAVVKLHFNLCHWPIAGRNGSSAKDSYMADIILIRVLVPLPPPTLSLPQKRKIPLFLEPESSLDTKKKKKA